jgi:hypothetical protein
MQGNDSTSSGIFVPTSCLFADADRTAGAAAIEYCGEWIDWTEKNSLAIVRRLWKLAFQRSQWRPEKSTPVPVNCS